MIDVTLIQGSRFQNARLGNTKQRLMKRSLVFFQFHREMNVTDLTKSELPRLEKKKTKKKGSADDRHSFDKTKDATGGTVH